MNKKTKRNQLNQAVAPSRPVLLWHYTTGNNLRMILRDGVIKTTDAFIDRKERPAAWFSSSQQWDSSATKGIVSMGKMRNATFEEMQTQAGGMCRIGIARNAPGLIDWRKFKRLSGISPMIGRGNEQIALESGSNCKWWYASFEPVGRDIWEAIQVLGDGEWLDIPVDEWDIIADPTDNEPAVSPVAGVPISREFGIYVQVSGDGDIDRFAMLFREVINRMPYESLTEIVDYWQRDGYRHFVRPNPLIIFSNTAADPKHGGSSAAVFDVWGHKIRFFSPVVDRMPDDIVNAMIAAQLGMVAALAQKPDMGEGQEARSRQVAVGYSIAEHWGYDIQSMVNWLESHRRDMAEWLEEARSVNDNSWLSRN